MENIFSTKRKETENVFTYKSLSFFVIAALDVALAVVVVAF